MSKQNENPQPEPQPETSTKPEKVFLKPDQTKTKELVRRNRFIAEQVAMVVPQLIDKPNTSFGIAYDSNADDDTKRRAFKGKVRAELGKALNAKRKLLARSLFIAEGDNCVEAFLQDFDSF